MFGSVRSRYSLQWTIDKTTALVEWLEANALFSWMPANADQGNVVNVAQVGVISVQQQSAGTFIVTVPVVELIYRG